MLPTLNHEYEVNRLYNRRKDIHARYGGQSQGGISTPVDCQYIILFTGESGAFPTKKDDALEELAATPAVVPHDLTGETRWQAIYELADLAGKNAIVACVPKPMVIEGSVYMDGLCGSASVVVHDARRGFARWLRTSGKGKRHYQAGYAVYARQSDQSVERAEAYANAFSRVLRRNGVSCRVETYLT